MGDTRPSRKEVLCIDHKRFAPPDKDDDDRFVCDVRLVWACDSKKNDGTVKLVLSNLNHSCDGTSKRKRAVRTEVLIGTNPALRNVSSTDKPQDVKERVQRETGDRISIPVAKKLVENAKGGTATELLFKHVQQLPALVAFLKNWDPAGTYLLEFDQEYQGSARDLLERFKLLYLSPSDRKRFAALCRPVLTDDFAHLKTFLKHCMLLCCIKDANEQPTNVAFGIARVENGYAWKVLYENAKRDFPMQTLHVNDAQKGSLSAAEQEEIDRQTCARHIEANCETRYPGTLGRLLRPIVHWISRSGTVGMFEAAFLCLHSAKSFQPFKHRLADVDKYLRGRAPEFASFMLLERGLSCFGEFLSNAVEQMNRVANPLRKGPWMPLIIGVLFTKPAAQRAARVRVAQNCKTRITPNVTVKMRVVLQEARKLKVTGLVLTDKFATGTVWMSDQVSVEVKLVLDGFLIVCACKTPLIIHRPCIHAAALFAAIDEEEKRTTKRATLALAEMFSYFDGNWVSHHYRVDTWKAQLGLGIDGEDVLFRVPTLDTALIALQSNFRLHREVPRPPGRPKKDDRLVPEAEKGHKKLDRVPSEKRHCWLCGGVGHNRNACNDPDLDHAYMKFMNDESLFVPRMCLEGGQKPPSPEDEAERMHPTREPLVEEELEALPGTVVKPRQEEHHDHQPMDTGIDEEEEEHQHGLHVSVDDADSDSDGDGYIDEEASLNALLNASENVDEDEKKQSDDQLAIDEAMLASLGQGIVFQLGGNDESDARKALGSQYCQACKNPRNAPAGPYKLIICGSCGHAFHMRSDCARPSPDSSQRAGKSRWKCQVCRGQAYKPK